MPLTFPTDRTGLTPPGTGPLQTGDEFTSDGRTWVYNADIPAWEGKATSADLTSGPVTSTDGESAIADGAIGVAKITGLGTAATTDATDYATAAQGSLADSALQAASIKGVVVTKADGTRTAYPPSANTDTARGIALEAAFAAAVAGDTIDLSPGNYYVAKATSSIAGITVQFAILDGMTIRLNGARLYKKSTDTASAMFAANGASGIDDWAIIGPGTLDGSYAANADTAARGSSAAEHGIHIRACRKVRIFGVTVCNFAGSGIIGNSATYATDEYSGGGSAKISTVHITDCNVDRNYYGLTVNQNNEYWNLSGTTLNKNVTGIDIYYAGNLRMIGGEITNNTNGVYVRHTALANSGHGMLIGVGINHNTGYALQVQTGMVNGMIFAGCNFYADSNTTNKIESLGSNVQFVACSIDSPIYCSATPSGLNTIKNCSIQGSFTTITDLSAAERAKWKFQNNYTATGVWASDDIRTTYADDAAAGTGGVLQGELWQQTTTGAVFVKL